MTGLSSTPIKVKADLTVVERASKFVAAIAVPSAFKSTYPTFFLTIKLYVLPLILSSAGYGSLNPSIFSLVSPSIKPIGSPVSELVMVELSEDLV